MYKLLTYWVKDLTKHGDYPYCAWALVCGLIMRQLAGSDLTAREIDKVFINLYSNRPQHWIMLSHKKHEEFLIYPLDSYIFDCELFCIWQLNRLTI